MNNKVFDPISSNLSFDQVIDTIRKYANGGEEVNVISNGTDKVGTIVFKKLAIFQSNFFFVFVTVAELDGRCSVLVTVKERQEGLIQMSWGKKEKIYKDIQNLI